MAPFIFRQESFVPMSRCPYALRCWKTCKDDTKYEKEPECFMPAVYEFPEESKEVVTQPHD